MSGRGYDVAVVGAGVGGLVVAALLARAGRSVILVDRAPRPGGVAQEQEVEGCRFGVGATLLSGFGPGGPLALLLQRLGLGLPVTEADPAFQVALPGHRISLWAAPAAWWREIRREFPDEEAGWRALWSELDEVARAREEALTHLPSLPPEGWRARLAIWRALTPGMLSPVPARTGGLLQRALRTPLGATLLRHGLGEASQRVVEAAVWYLLLRGAEDCSTLEAAVAMRQVRRGVASTPGGTAALVEALAGKFRKDGGELRLETPVDHLLVEGGRVTGLVTAAGETIRARWVVADVAPDVLAGTLLPPRRGRRRRHGLEVPWQADRVTEAMVLAVPERLLPSELCGHCLVVRDAGRPAREENLVFVRTAAAAPGGEGNGALRCLTVGRFVAARGGPEAQATEAELLEALDQIVPGVGSAMAFHRLLTPTALAEAWGRPSAAVRYAVESRDWLGQRGLPHRLAWPGLLAVGGWTYPGRLVGDVIEGAMRVADLIGEEA